MRSDLIDVPIEPAIADVPHWGPMTPARHRLLARRGIWLRVYVGCDDVTLRCRYFDDTPGRSFAELFVLTPDGRHILRDASGHRPKLERVRGFLVREGLPIPGGCQ